MSFNEETAKEQVKPGTEQGGDLQTPKPLNLFILK